MKFPAILAALVLSFAQAKLQAAEGAVFPGNEAVRIVNGKRVVERPPLTPGQKQAMANPSKWANRVPFRPGDPAYGEVSMIELESGLMECAGHVPHTNRCRPSSLGQVVLTRIWLVKLDGKWLACGSRKPDRRCDTFPGPDSAFGLTAVIGTPE